GRIFSAGVRKVLAPGARLEPLLCFEPDARYAPDRIAGRIAAVVAQRAARADQEIAFLAEARAEAVARERALVRRVGHQRFLVQLRPAGVVERRQGHVAFEHLEAGHDVAQLAGEDHADVARRLADRI